MLNQNMESLKNDITEEFTYASGETGIINKDDVDLVNNFEV